MPHGNSHPIAMPLARGLPARLLFAGAVILSCFFGPPLGAAQQPPTPTVNADVGGCTADFTVRGGEGKPLYDASIALTFRYGFWNLHKASLQAFTDSKGRARFEGLPSAPKKPLEFVVRYGHSQKRVTDDPGATCNAQFTVALE